MQNEYEAKFRELWLTVIQRAQEEAEGNYMFEYGNQAKMKLVQRRAKKWLTRETKSFYKVCELAGLSCDEAQALLEVNKRKYGVN